MNSAVRLNFKVDFVKFRTCRSYEQYMRTREKNTDTQNVKPTTIQTHIYLFFGGKKGGLFI